MRDLELEIGLGPGGCVLRVQPSPLFARAMIQTIDRRVEPQQSDSLANVSQFKIIALPIKAHSFRWGPAVYFGVGEATSFWKRGSFRSGSNIGSSRRSAGVSSTFTSAPSYGIDSSFCKAA